MEAKDQDTEHTEMDLNERYSSLTELIENEYPEDAADIIFGPVEEEPKDA